MDAILIGMALKGTIVLAVAWLTATLLRRHSAAARHLVWTSAAAAVIALPILSVGLPALQMPAPVVDLSAASSVVFRVFATAKTDAVPATKTVADAPRPAQRRASLPAAGPVLIFVWVAGAAIVMLQMVVAYGVMSRRRRTSPVFDSEGLTASGVDILQAEPGSMPMTFGLLRPVVFLPADARDWPEERRRMVLLHELAHARRGDVATHLMARTALSLHWWNPLAWIAWREFLKERERAADDLVLQAGARASEYAAHLLEVARTMQRAPASAVAVAMARPSQLEGRLLAILDAGKPRGSATGLASLAAVLLAVALAVPFAAVRAQTQAVTPEIDATIRAAISQKNHEILDRAARAYEERQNFEVAQTLLEAALPIRGDVSGQQSAAYAAGLVKLGDLAVKRRQTAEAHAFYAKAVSLGDRPEVVPALMYLGLQTFREKDRDAAFGFFERAYNVEPQGKQAGQALRWMALVRQNQPDRIGEAESLFQRAIALEDPKSFEAATTRELYAMFLRQQGDHDKAVTVAAEATISRNLGRAVGELKESSGVSGAFQVGGDVSRPTLIYKVEPEYSEEARAAKYQGTVLLYVEIGADGRARNIKVARALGLGLDEKAIESIRQWRFKPGEKEGVPVTTAATIEVNFRLM